MSAEQMGITFIPNKASVDPVAVGCRKTVGNPERATTERNWRAMNGGAFHYKDGELYLSKDGRS